MTTACLPLLCLQIIQLAGEGPDVAAPQQAEAARIYRAIDEETAFEFVNKPLKTALSELAQQRNINLVVSSRGLRYAAVDESADVNLILNGVRLRSALKILLDEFDLDYTVQDEVVMVSSAADVKASTTLHSYDVTALLNDGDIDALVVAVREQISESPQQTARVSGYQNLLLVTGNRYVQEGVQRTLTVLKEGLKVAPINGK